MSSENPEKNMMRVDSPEDAAALEKLKPELKKLMMAGALHNDVFPWDDMVREFISGLEAKGVSKEELSRTRMYHELVGGTLHASSQIDQFDTPRNDFQNFIEDEARELEGLGFE